MGRAAEEAEETALGILEEMVAQQQQAEGSGEGSEKTQSTTPSQHQDDWDFPVSKESSSPNSAAAKRSW